MNPRAEQTQRVRASPKLDPYAFRTVGYVELIRREAELRKSGLTAAANAIKHELEKRQVNAK